MKNLTRTALRAALFLLSATVVFSSCDSKSETQTMVNPLTYTDIPDNDVIRVGDKYYMVSTTMYFCPGAPVMESDDLVHWRIVNYIYDCLADDDIYNLRNGRNAYGKGQWATTLRYVDGVYYALFIANDQAKTFVYRTDDIVNGQWQCNIIDKPFHDATLLFEDGRVFVVYGNGTLFITELEPDLSAIKEGGVDQVLFESPREGYGLRAEGAHIYHIGEYYYVLVIDWPSDPGCRTETAYRSKDLLGPYESKVVLQGKFDGRNDGVAQGAIFETQYGDWYAMMFQDHGAVGRIPTLQPVTWVDGWPMMGDNGTPLKEFEVNLPASGEDYVWASDEFDSPDLALVWQWNHKPVAEAWTLTERPGWMRLKTTGIAEDITQARNTLTQRSVGPNCTSEVLLDASGLKPGDRAGLCAFQSNNFSLGVEVAEDGSKILAIREMKKGTRLLTDADGKPMMRNGRPAMERFAENNIVYSEPLESENIWLKINFVFTPSEGSTDEADTATAHWSYDGKNYKTADYILKMQYSLDFFTGYRPALYSYSTVENGGYADFGYFHQEVY